MNNSMLAGVLVIAVGLMAGCSAAAKSTAGLSQSQRTDVFQEVSGESAVPPGYADLTLKASIKTHIEGYYLLESGESVHGKPDYPFVVNIDGQAAAWNVNGKKDVKPAYDERGQASTDPEAREGVKYILERKLRLRPGAHKVYLGLPEEKYSLTVDINLREGEKAVLEFKPIYRYKTLPTRVPTFLRGICDYEGYLNGVKLN